MVKEASQNRSPNDGNSIFNNSSMPKAFKNYCLKTVIESARDL